MKCELSIQKNLLGFYDVLITTPKGTKVFMNPVCKDAKTKSKLLFKLQCECKEDAEEKSASVTK